MKSTYIKTIKPHVELHRCKRTGIAWIEDGTTGMGHSAHPNIDATGSVKGMKSLGYWGQKDICVKTKGYIYNISKCHVSDKYDEIARNACRCGGKH